MNRPVPEILVSHTRPSRRAFGAFILLLVLSISLAACIRDEDLTLEQRQHQLEQELMCPVCDGQTLDQSQAQISRDMKGIISEKLQTGETNAQIKDYFVARYGEEVLASPTTGGFNLIAWLMPVLIAGGGIAILIFALRGMRKPAQQRTPARDQGLERYLERVDHDLGIDDRPSADGERRSG